MRLNECVVYESMHDGLVIDVLIKSGFVPSSCITKSGLVPSSQDEGGV